jgi:hypothetical protein
MIERVCAPLFHQTDSSCKLANPDLKFAATLWPSNRGCRASHHEHDTMAKSERAGQALLIPLRKPPSEQSLSATS